MLADEVNKILKEAERKIASLLAGAGRDGDYQLVKAIADVAEQLAAISFSGTDQNAGVAEMESPSQDYPLYELRKDYLVKTGKSATSQRVYSHKVPITLVRAFMAILQRLEVEQELSAEFFSAKLKLDRKHAIPEYQIYTLIGWSEKNNYISRKGRGIYTVRLENLTQGDQYVLGVSKA